MRKIFLFLLILGLCVANEPPKWFVQPHDNENVLVGFGSGSSLQDAKSNALSDLASTISVHVDSQTSLNQERNDIALKSFVSNQISLQVKDIELSNVEVLDLAVVGDVFFVKLGVKRLELIAQFQRQIQERLDAFGLLDLDGCQYLDPKTFFVFQEGIKELDRKVRILELLTHRNFIHSKLHDLFEILKKNTPKPLANLSFEGVDEDLKNSLMKEFLKFSNFSMQAISQASSIKVIGSGRKNALKLRIVIMNCQEKILFQDAFTFDAKSLKRANFIIYKSLKKWVEQ